MQNTTPDAVPYPEAGDPLNGLDEYLNQLATRVQALVKNLRTLAGTSNITPSAAGTNTTQRVNFGETFDSTPRVVVSLAEGANAGAVTLWANAEDTTGFTLGINASGTATRAVRWVAVQQVGAW